MNRLDMWVWLHFLIADRSIYENVLHFEVVRKKMVAKNDIDGLAAEARRKLNLRVAAEHGSTALATKEAVDCLYRADSALRESMRTSDVAVVNLYHDVVSGHDDIGNGVRLPAGVRFAFPTQNIHLDADNYPEPLRYDAFRFSRLFENIDAEDKEQDDEEQLLVTKLTPTFLPFGYGRYACPGRWFATQTMKQALAYLVTYYDVELVGKPVKRRVLLHAMVLLVDAINANSAQILRV
ncbi:cytochrome P450 [Podospora didyma]|uniref:Cytochrome P450 n=1 Tax=Podospora didyma TaxID=330526 RepID=A0AAE0U6N8_9PEZI|nr:cytochrome P450 [Podospora didyma]